MAYAIASNVEMTSFTSRTAGIVGSTATAAAATPGPHQPVAAALAVGATGVGLAADAMEHLLSNNPTGFIETQIKIGVPAHLLIERFPLYAPIINEITESIKQQR